MRWKEKDQRVSLLVISTQLTPPHHARLLAFASFLLSECCSSHYRYELSKEMPGIPSISEEWGGESDSQLLLRC